MLIRYFIMLDSRNSIEMVVQILRGCLKYLMMLRYLIFLLFVPIHRPFCIEFTPHLHRRAHSMSCNSSVSCVQKLTVLVKESWWELFYFCICWSFDVKWYWLNFTGDWEMSFYLRGIESFWVLRNRGGFFLFMFYLIKNSCLLFLWISFFFC